MGLSNVRGVPGWQGASARSLGAVIDGRTIASQVREATARDVASFVERTRRTPGLATILVGNDAASAVYVAAKQKASREVGITPFHHELPESTTQAELETLIAQLNRDDAVSGILCQLPLPPHLDGVAATGCIAPAKDVDGLTAASAGALMTGADGLRPCTPAGVMVLLDMSSVPLKGAHALVIGRSNLFGKPMAQLLLAADATVTMAHRHTQDLPTLCQAADVLIVAVGRERMVKADWVKTGAVVIDVGINRTQDGLCGDVDFPSVREVASAITPVPGGVGPMTIAMLLRNTLFAAEAAGRSGRRLTQETR